MKGYLSALCLFSALGILSTTRADDSASIEPAAGKAGNDSEPAGYLILKKQELELRAQLTVLAELAQEHRKRSEEAARGNQSEKSKWEEDLAKELSERAAALLAQVNEVIRQRNAFEQTHPPVVASTAASVAAGLTNGPNPYELAYLTKLQEKLAALEQELATARDKATVYAAELRTNSMPAGFAKVSAQLQENGRYTRQLEKEKADLELKELEFRALRNR